MKERFWFTILMFVNWRLEGIDNLLWLLSEIEHKKPNLAKGKGFKFIFGRLVHKYGVLRKKRDKTIGKCERLYWNWIERPFLIRW